jgi:hypothetical protein
MSATEAKASDRSMRMRARRLRVEEIKLGYISVVAKHPELGKLEGAAEDVSMHGLSVVLTGAPEGERTLLVGDRLDDVVITCDAGTLYEGHALVRRISAFGDDLEDLNVGLELDHRGLDLGWIYRSGARREFAKRWEAVSQHSRYAGIKPEFKAWIADMRTLVSGGDV